MGWNDFAIYSKWNIQNLLFLAYFPCQCIAISEIGNSFSMAAFSLRRITSWTFFLSVCLQNNICYLHVTSVFTGNLTQKIKFELRKRATFKTSWRRKRFSSYICAKEESFLPEDAVNVPRNEEDETKHCNARTRSARRRRVLGGS